MSLRLESFKGLYLYRDFVDFRKSIDGLARVVVDEMQVELRVGNLFVFMGRRKDRVKILYFDRSGFALWYKRLEREKFKWPRHMEEKVLKMSLRDLELLLEGIDVWRIRPHATLNLSRVY